MVKCETPKNTKHEPVKRCRICGVPVDEHEPFTLLNPCVVEAYIRGISQNE